MQALRSLQEVEDEALGFLDSTRDAIQLRRNQQVWIRLLIQGPSCMMIEIVTTLGALEPMTHQELFSPMVAINWMLKQRVPENMRISWTRKREDRLHTFNWEATLMVPTAAGCAHPPADHGNNITSGLQGCQKCRSTFSTHYSMHLTPSREMRHAVFIRRC